MAEAELVQMFLTLEFYAGAVTGVAFTEAVVKGYSGFLSNNTPSSTDSTSRTEERHE